MRHLVTTILVAVLLIATHAAHAADDASINKRIQIRPMLEPGLSAAEGLRARLHRGLNVQAIVSIPGAMKPGGTLLDPNAVSIRWNEEELPLYVHYKAPQTALLFALLPLATIEKEPTGELSVSARLLGSTDIDAGWRIPLTLTSDDLTTITLAREKRIGRAVTLLDEDSSPLEDAFLFGQRRLDLLGQSDANGIVMLDSFTRNDSEPHHAWSPGHWTRSFDPISTTTLTLARKDPARDRSIEVIVRDHFNVPMPEAVIIVENNFYFDYMRGAENRFNVPGGRAATLIVLGAGYDPVRVTVAENQERVEVRLDSLIVKAVMQPPGPPQ